MRMLALLLLAAVGSTAAAAGPADVVVQAERVEATGLTGDAAAAVLVASGDVRATAGALQLRAPRLVVERARHLARLEGGVTAVDGLLVVSAKALELDLDARALTLDGGVVHVKRGVDAAQLRALASSPTPAAAAAAGHNALTLRTGRLVRGAGDAFSATDTWLTTCDCPDDATPLLSVSAGRVEVMPGDAATLHDWALRLFGVRLLPFDLPFPLALPLTSRRTGVLFPRLALDGPGGASVELPVFVTLGESADLTLRTRYFHGTAAATSRDERTAGVRGLGEGLEARWRPASGAQGFARVDLLRDTSLTAFGTARGWRADAAVQHEQPLLGGRLALHGELVTDNAVLLDTYVALDRAQLPYLRSAATFSRPSAGAGGVALESAAVQDLRGPAASMPSGSVLRFPLSRTPATVAPLARAVVGQSFLVGPAVLDANATGAWEDALPGLSLEAGHARRATAELSLGQLVPVLRGRAGEVAVEAGERWQGLVPADGAALQRLGGFAGARGTLRFGRTFAGGWRHDVVPSVHLRALWSPGGFSNDLFLPRIVDGRAPTPGDPARAPQSELDLALPNGLAAQAVARLETTLSHGTETPLLVFAEQHAALLPTSVGQLAFGATFALPESFAHARLALGGGWLASRRLFTDATARATVLVAGGSLSIGARYLAGSLSDQLARGLDFLFAPQVARPAAVVPLRQADASVDWPVARGLHVQLGAVVARAAGGANPTTTQQYWTGAAYDAGGCARLSAQVRWTPAPPNQPFAWPVVGLAFELGDVGQAAAAAAGSLVEPR